MVVLTARDKAEVEVTKILFEDWKDGVRMGATKEDFEDLAAVIVAAVLKAGV